ncbi:hypothetical protein G7B40_041895 [Aetokthonos hydrillicola Thurmond2011]|uniref:Uncharacterized protein n=1 Tax=Aetokthonos hydrillicola Thurmond2011 TaxID=2712845 RepID=A0AAP5MEE9_9CYAN|nr:hypothetical protein [Aetokthonos hydrillicola Thurmond2011]
MKTPSSVNCTSKRRVGRAMENRDELIGLRTTAVKEYMGFDKSNVKLRLSSTEIHCSKPHKSRALLLDSFLEDVRDWSIPPGILSYR